MAIIASIKISKTGSDILSALTAAADGDDVVYKSGTLIIARNNDASSSTLTIAKDASTTDTPNYGSLAVADLTFILAQNAVTYFTLPPGYSINNNVNLAISNATDFEVGVFTLGN
jgi:hypothetical protein